MTIEYKRGNAFAGSGEAIVVTTNCIGAMGAGIALECKIRMPWLYNTYKRYCRRGVYSPGRISQEFGVFKEVRKKSEGNCAHDVVILMPTKFDWRNDSKVEWVDSGLADLAELSNQFGWERVDMPAPGYGNGNIKDIDLLKHLLEKHLGKSATHFVVHIK